MQGRLSFLGPLLHCQGKVGVPYFPPRWNACRQKFFLNRPQPEIALGGEPRRAGPWGSGPSAKCPKAQTLGQFSKHTVQDLAANMSLGQSWPGARDVSGRVPSFLWRKPRSPQCDSAVPGLSSSQPGSSLSEPPQGPARGSHPPGLVLYGPACPSAARPSWCRDPEHAAGDVAAANAGVTQHAANYRQRVGTN